MGAFAIIHPRDDGPARQASDWCRDLAAKLNANGHRTACDVDDRTPADFANIALVFGNSMDLICYFGHGDENSWLTNGSATLDISNVKAQGEAVVSIACKTGCNLGPHAITAGATSWLAFTIKVPVIKPHKNADPMGDAIVDGLACLGAKGTMQQARDEIAANFDQLIGDFDTGRLSSHPAASIGYYAAMSMRDHVVLHGQTSHQPLP